MLSNALLFVCYAIPSVIAGNSFCKCVRLPTLVSKMVHGLRYVQAPTDSCWPSLAEWSSLNRTVAGKLIKNVQPAAACYPGPYQDDAKCEYINSQWRSQDFHSSTPIGLSYPTESCPVLNLTAGQQPAQSCTLGDQPVYTVNAMEASDVSKGIKFAKRHNLRLVIRDTGHDLLRR